MTSQYTKPGIYGPPDGFMEVIYVNENLDNLNRRYILKCPDCRTKYNIGDIVNEFVTKREYRNLETISLGVDCRRCNKQYRIYLSVPKYITFTMDVQV